MNSNGIKAGYMTLYMLDLDLGGVGYKLVSMIW